MAERFPMRWYFWVFKSLMRLGGRDCGVCVGFKRFSLLFGVKMVVVLVLDKLCFFLWVSVCSRRSG